MINLCDLKAHCPDARDFSKSFMYSIHQMYFLVEKHLEHVLGTKSSLTFSQFMVMIGFQSEESASVSQTAIAERLNITEATVSRHVSILVEQGYLSRVEDKANRRKHVISVTPKGKKVFVEANHIIDAELHSIFDVIPSKDRVAIIKNFQVILAHLLKKK